MRVTTRTNLALRVLMSCAVQRDTLIKTAEIAESCNCSVHHAAHVVQRLQASGVLATVRGRAGGLRLARPVEAISIGSVVREFEADIPLAECFNPETNTCPLVSACRLRSYLARAIEAFYHELDQITLHDLVEGNCGLYELLGARPVAPGCAG
ncbi:RrF2 family transcriptional regulator [Pseudothioclava arenosa]|uniref:Transcriptional regulator n=1 Tax=Pseudothioclava arenosa TaxID=1795308 RepID=A0A2A4CQ62_9RHOB|nr:Rrf2 family transcriptional regulator [Pseudothioclava arenosa]PCD76256.1 transcriptional regulator [Pseudothioclava arenosa]